MRRLSILLACAALALGASACGGDDDDDSADAPTKEEFVEEANARCQEFNDVTEAAFADLAEDADIEEVAAVLTSDLIPPFRAMLDDLRDLTPPEGDEEAVEAFWDEGEELMDEFEAGLEDDPEATLNAEEDPFADINERMIDYGLGVCGDDPGEENEVDDSIDDSTTEAPADT